MVSYEHILSQGYRKARDIEKKIKEARAEAARYSFEGRDQIISRLNFGFWVNMLSRKRDELWQKPRAVKG